MRTYAGIDYSFGRSNYNKKTGIHFGVIPAGEVGESWYEGAEAHYEGPNCEEASEFTYDGDGIIAQQSGDDADIFILKSQYFTYAQYCSPCAPGALYLLNPLEGTDGPRAYCFGHEWFDGDVAPYPVYSVNTGKLVAPKEKK